MRPAKKAVRRSHEAEQNKQTEFVELAEKLRDTRDPYEAKRLGDKLGRMMFGA